VDEVRTWFRDNLKSLSVRRDLEFLKERFS